MLRPDFILIVTSCEFPDYGAIKKDWRVPAILNRASSFLMLTPASILSQ